MEKTTAIRRTRGVHSLVLALAVLSAWMLGDTFNPVLAHDDDMDERAVLMDHRSSRQASDPIPFDLSIVPDPCNSEATQRWGVDDQRGNFNYITPAKVREALKLAKEGRLIHLDHLLEPGRNGVIGNFTIQTFRTAPPAGATPFNITTHERAMQPLDISPVSAQAHNAIGQQGAQIDAWNHMGMNGVTYNCFDLLDDHNLFVEPDIRDPSQSMFAGYKAMGIDQLGTIITRGILIDVAAYKREQLATQGEDITDFPPPRFGYTPEDLEGTLERQGLALQDFEPGDIIFVRTGWAARFWTADPENVRNDRTNYFGQSAAGPTTRASKWIVNRQPAAIALDNGGIAPSEPPFDMIPGIGHGMFMANGVTLLENFDMELLAKDAVKRKDYTFLLIFQPLKIRGGSGSSIVPVAVR